jgi:hypothetical protein
MHALSLHLLRERIEVFGVDAPSGAEPLALVPRRPGGRPGARFVDPAAITAPQEARNFTVLSNRIALPSTIAPHAPIIRAHTMHLCTRMAAHVLDACNTRHTSLQTYDWDVAWDTAVSAYEAAHNPRRWFSLYLQGRCIASVTHNNAVLDIIEARTAKSQDMYKDVTSLVRATFAEMGWFVRVAYDANIGLKIETEGGRTKAYFTVRAAQKGSHDFTLEASETVDGPAFLMLCADYLESIQLCFVCAKGPSQTDVALAAQARLAQLVDGLPRQIKVLGCTHHPAPPDFGALMGRSLGAE